MFARILSTPNLDCRSSNTKWQLRAYHHTRCHIYSDNHSRAERSPICCCRKTRRHGIFFQRFSFTRLFCSAANTRKPPVPVTGPPLKWKVEASRGFSKDRGHHRFDAAAQQRVLCLHADHYSPVVCPEYRAAILQVEDRIAIVVFFHFSQISDLSTDRWNELRRL